MEVREISSSDVKLIDPELIGKLILKDGKEVNVVDDGTIPQKTSTFKYQQQQPKRTTRTPTVVESKQTQQPRISQYSSSQNIGGEIVEDRDNYRLYVMKIGQPRTKVETKETKVERAPCDCYCHQKPSNEELRKTNATKQNKQNKNTHACLYCQGKYEQKKPLYMVEYQKEEPVTIQQEVRQFAAPMMEEEPKIETRVSANKVQETYEPTFEKRKDENSKFNDRFVYTQHVKPPKRSKANYTNDQTRTTRTEERITCQGGELCPVCQKRKKRETFVEEYEEPVEEPRISVRERETKTFKSSAKRQPEYKDNYQFKEDKRTSENKGFFAKLFG